MAAVLSGTVKGSVAGAVTRCEVMAHAEAWVNANVMYSQGPYGGYCPGGYYADPWAGGANYRPDCSGYVSAVWGLAAPGHTTYSFAGGPWDSGASYVIDPADLRPGDAVNFAGVPSAGTGHIRLVGGWKSPGVLWGYEQSTCNTPAHYWEASWSSMVSSYVAIRLQGIQDCNEIPRGTVDGITQDGRTLFGWAQDPDTPTQPLSVHVYLGGPAGTPGAWSAATVANVARADLCTALGSCAHGFELRLPPAFRDGTARDVYAYAFDTGTGHPTLLSGSPTWVTSQPPPLPAGVRRWVSSTAFGAWRFSFDEAYRRSLAQVTAVARGADFPASPVMVRADDGSPQVWILDGSERRHLQSEASAAAWQLDLSRVTVLPVAQVKGIKEGKPWRLEPFLVMSREDGAVYVVDAAPSPPAGGADGGTAPPASDGGSEGGPNGLDGGEPEDAAPPDGGQQATDGGVATVPSARPLGCSTVPVGAVWLGLLAAALGTARGRPRR